MSRAGSRRRVLGRLYAQAGRPQEAIDTARQALAIARQAGDQRLIEGLTERPAAYEAAGKGQQRSEATGHSKTDEQ